ncbi:MAG: flagellar biosynthesis protein P, partial [Myxococcales bacterium]|nr:flagellar biosynthesis protein P [Myxococcales bacterium]
SGLVDGVALDVAWDDANDDYLSCNGQALVTALNLMPAPLDGQLAGIGTWTKGALDRAAVEISQTKADHPEDGNSRGYGVIVITDGPWTGVDGTTTLAPASQNPGLTAASLFGQGVPTYVVAVAGNAQTKSAADALASAGGTTGAVYADAYQTLEDDLIT